MRFFFKQFNLHLEEKELQLLLEIQAKLELTKRLEFTAKEVLNFFSLLQQE
jgi:hypothetical protein